MMNHGLGEFSVISKSFSQVVVGDGIGGVKFFHPLEICKGVFLAALPVLDECEVIVSAVAV